MSSSREFQLVLYGATGFTGNLAVRYLSQNYSGKIRWAIAGRSESKLQQLASTFEPAPGIIIADSSDEAALRRLASRTEAVATCAGPFSRYGSKLVAACVAEGTGYSDITGEIGWVREMIAEYHDKAAASGARIVHLCGHDSVPWDLMTLMLAKKLREKGEDLASVDMFDDIRSKPSGGTLETAIGILFGKDGKGSKSTAVKSLGFDPLLKLSGTSTPSINSVCARNVSVLEISPKPRTMFVMAGVNANAVKRSNAINGYGPKVIYREGQVFKSIAGAVAYICGMMTLGLLLFVPPTRWLLRKFVLPAPGEGPSEEFMKSGYLTVEGRAVGSKGTKVNAKMRFVVDPGYLDTARMVVESALALALDKDKIKVAGGVYTPAACQGEVLLNRLLATGTSFEYM